ncbi:MAG: hypothetical protein WCC63_02380 [Candidatus Bathyarchaeia archaeon]
MRKTLKLLTVVSRPEFLPANSASIVIGVSWGITLPVDMIWGFAVPISLLFAIITLVATFAAQVNTVSDYEIDLKVTARKNSSKPCMNWERTGFDRLWLQSSC